MKDYYIQICDNFFPTFLHRELIANLLVPGNKFMYQPNITYNPHNDLSQVIKESWKKDNKITGSEGFVFEVNEEFENYKNLEKNLNTFIENKFNVKVKKIIRIMLVYLPPNPSFDENSFLGPHVDIFNINHLNLLYYFFDNDADTLFFDQIHDINTKVENQNYCKLNIYKKVQVKENRAVLFNGLIYHSGNVSKYSKRITLNVNFLPEIEENGSDGLKTL